MSVFTIRVFKSWGARDATRRWVNSYEVSSVDPTDPPALVDTALQIVNAERAIHLQSVQFLEATISTWSPDSHPYDPTSFYTVELTGTGGRDGGDGAGNPTALDSNVCYVMKRQVTGGLNGKLFYRGCLVEGDVAMAGDGHFTINSAAMLVGGANYNAYHGDMLTLLGAGENPFALALISNIAGHLTIRPVGNLIPRGVSVNRRDHRYFTRH